MPPRRWLPYRTKLTSRAQALRRDPSPQKKKPLGAYVADFYCSSKRLVIELDGDSHFTEAAERYDAMRTARLELEGLRVIRFTNLDVMENFESVCHAVTTALERNP